MSDAWAAPLLAQTADYLGKMPAALITLLMGAVIIKLLQMIVIRAAAIARVDRTLASLLKSIIGFAGWVMTLAAAMAAMGLQQISLALGGSVALVAMALASGLNTITQDLMAGIFLISDEDFRVGYTVKAAGLEGVIEQVTIRKTKIRDAQGLLHAIPNRTIDSATYTVVSAPKPGKQGSGAILGSVLGAVRGVLPGVEHLAGAESDDEGSAPATKEKAGPPKEPA